MNDFFDLDGPFYKWGTEVADVMILTLLWLVCSLPVLTIGASTTALFYVYGKKVRGEDPYVFRSFFKGFKDNFKQATIITFILGMLWMSVYLYHEILTSGAAQVWVQMIGLFYIIQVIIITMYLFPVLSRFQLTIKNLFITSFILGHKHLPTTLLCGVLFMGSIFLFISTTPFAIFAFGIYALISSYLFQRVFTRHIELLKKENIIHEKKEVDLEEVKEIG